MAKNESMMEYQKAIEYIFSLVREGKLIIGSKLPSERDMAMKLGIGRNSTREAMCILRGMGLIESIHGSGNYISRDCGKSIKHIVSAMLALGSVTKKDFFEFKKVVSKAVSLFIMDSHFTEESKVYVEQILSEMETADPVTFVKLDQQFHKAMIHATGNPLFIMIMEPISEVFLESVQEAMEKADDETRKILYDVHKNIYKSVCAKDGDACSKYMSAHYNLALMNL